MEGELLTLGRVRRRTPVSWPHSSTLHSGYAMCCLNAGWREAGVKTTEWEGVFVRRDPAGIVNLPSSVLQAWGRSWRWWGRFRICHPACPWPTTPACWPLSSSTSSTMTCAVTQSVITSARSVRSTSREFPGGLTGLGPVLVISGCVTNHPRIWQLKTTVTVYYLTVWQQFKSG